MIVKNNWKALRLSVVSTLFLFAVSGANVYAQNGGRGRGAAIVNVPPPTSPVTGNAANGKKVFLTSFDCIQPWNLDTGLSLSKLPSRIGAKLEPQFSADDRWVLLWEDAANVIDSTTGAPASPTLRQATYLMDAAISPDGQTVATGGAEPVLVLIKGRRAEMVVLLKTTTSVQFQYW